MSTVQAAVTIQLRVAPSRDAAVFVGGWIHRELAAQANDSLRGTFGPDGRPYVAVQQLFAREMVSALARLEHGQTWIVTALTELLKRSSSAADDVVEELRQKWPVGRGRPRDNLAQAGATRNPAFVGRSADLTRLRALIDDPNGPSAVAIVAGAGFGKTELARAFLNEGVPTGGAGASEWYGRWWLDGSVGGEVASLTTHVPIITGVPLPPEPQAGTDDDRAQHEWRRALRRRVADACSDGRHLLVLDNAESAEQIRDYRPANAGRLIATTQRQPIPAATAATLPVDVLLADDARVLLTTMRADLRAPAHAQALDALAEHLGQHALGLAYAAALLAGPPLTDPGALLSRLRTHDVGEEGHLLSDLREDALGTEYRLPLAQSLGLLFEELADPVRALHNPLAVRLAGYASFCDPAAIPIDLLARASGVQAAALESALRALHERSIINWTDHVSMHRLTQSLVRSRLRLAGDTDSVSVRSSLVSALGALFADQTDHTLLALRAACWPHAEAVLQRVETPEAFRLRADLSSHLRDIGVLAGALSHIDAAIAWDERQQPVDDRKTIGNISGV